MTFFTAESAEDAEELQKISARGVLGGEFPFACVVAPHARRRGLAQW